MHIQHNHRKLIKLVRELRREANEQATTALTNPDVATREFLRGMAHGRREAASRIENEHLPVSVQRELLKNRGRYAQRTSSTALLDSVSLAKSRPY